MRSPRPRGKAAGCPAGPAAGAGGAALSMAGAVSAMAGRGGRGLVPCLVALLLLVSAASLLLGPAGLPAQAVLRALLGEGDAATAAIVLQVRLPRLLLSIGVGAMLAAAGAALQGYLRNPLAEPSVLGASGGAALGAVIALYFGLAAAFPLALPLCGVAGALAALAAVLGLARWSESPLALILAGIAVGAGAGAAISLALNLSPNPFAAMEIAFWLLGSVEDRSLRHVLLAWPLIAAGLVLLAWDRRALDALTLGEEAAQSLGFDLRRVRLRLVVGVALGVGGATAVAGAIGFLGLVVPHLLRPFTGFQPSRLILPSALGGAVLLTAADVLVRLVPTASELKLGVVTALLGVPVFVSVVLKARRVW